MSATLPVIPREPTVRYITPRRVRRCLADGRGAILVLETADAFVIDPAVVALLVHALDVRDGRSTARYQRFVKDLESFMPPVAPEPGSDSRLPPAPPAAPDGSPLDVPTWFIVTLVVVVLATALLPTFARWLS